MTQIRFSECERLAARSTAGNARPRNLPSVPSKIASCSAALVIAGALALFAAPSARAGTITVNSVLQQGPSTTAVCTLGAAISSANTGANVDGCTGATAGANTIVIPAGNYVLTTVQHTGLSGDFGLPAVAGGPLTLQGASAAACALVSLPFPCSIIQRSTVGGTPNFGLLEMGGTGPWTINDLSFQNANAVNSNGAAIRFVNLAGVFNLNRSTFLNNSTGLLGGGAITTYNGNIVTTIADSSFTNNSAVGDGGAILGNPGNLTITNTTFSGNSATAAGGALNISTGPLSITDSTFSSNTAQQSGGALVGPPTTSITRTVFLNNATTVAAGTGGGAISFGNGCGGPGGGQRVIDSFFTGNVSPALNCGGGGAISCVGCTISGSTFQGNRSGGPGGALGVTSSTITNSTFSGNIAATDGGAISSANSNTYNNITVTNNSSQSSAMAGGISFGTSDAIRNSIIAGNSNAGGTTALDCSTPPVPASQGHNLIGNGTGCAIVPGTGDKIGTAAAPVDPVLGVLAANAGKTAGSTGNTRTIPTHALLVGSPALDAGDPAVPGSGGTSCAATDERGTARPQGPVCDIGAFEAVPNTGVIPNVDVSVTVSGAPDPVTAPNNLTYTITVSNTVADTAPGITLTDVLPASVTFVSINTPAGWAPCTTPAVGSTGTVTCTKTSLAAGASSVFSLVVKTSTGGPLPNTVTVATTGNDTNPANNTATATTTVVPAGTADLAITKTGSGLTTFVGAPFTYIINISNAGPSSATNVVVTDTLPTGVTYGSATPSGSGSCTQAGVTVTCTYASLANGGSASITIIVTPTTTGTIVNTATVNAAEADPTPADNTATTAPTTVVPPSADLALTKTGAPNPVLVGNNLTYTLVVTNNGPSNATGVVLTDTLPANVTFGPITGTGCSRTGSIVTCNIGALANAATSTVTIVVTPQAAAAPSIPNSASVTATEMDPNLLNNTASTTTTVTPAADLAITKTASPAGSVRVGSTLTYTITVTNNGPSAASGVTVTDTLPAANKFTPGPGTVTTTPGTTCLPPAAGKIVCTIATLASGATATATVPITPTAAAVGTITNSVTVLANETDPNMANNSASVTTTITPATGPDFTITLTPASVTVARGNTATYTATVTPIGGFTGTVNLDCSGAPFLANCVITPSSVSITDANPKSASVTVQTTTAWLAPNAMRSPQNSPWPPQMTPAITFAAAMLLALFAFGAFAFIGSRAGVSRVAHLFRGGALRTRRFAALTALVLLVICAGYLSGCEGHARKVVGTPSGTFPITVTATSGSIQHSATAALTVQ